VKLPVFPAATRHLATTVPQISGCFGKVAIDKMLLISIFALKE
jgi:hypothetical protein